MDEELLCFFIKVMKSWLHGSQDVVRFKADDIVEETSEFINLTFDLDIWSGIFLKEGAMLVNLALK